MFVLLNQRHLFEVSQNTVVFGQALVLLDEGAPLVPGHVGFDRQGGVQQILPQSLHYEPLLVGILADVVKILQKFGNIRQVLLGHLGDFVGYLLFQHVDYSGVQPPEKRLVVDDGVIDYLLHFAPLYQEGAVGQHGGRYGVLVDAQNLRKSNEHVNFAPFIRKAPIN